MGLPLNSVSDLPLKKSAVSMAKKPETGSATLPNESAIPLSPRSVSSPSPSGVISEKPAATSSKSTKRKRDSDDVESVNPEKRFMSQIFDIYVGTEKQHFTAHEVFLAHSPRLKLMCTAKKTIKKGNTKLIFPFDHPSSFAHLLEYLYFSIIAIPTSESVREARQLADLFSVAKKFQLPEMQEDIISRLDSSGISSRLSAMEFFGLADDLFSEGIVQNLHKYFAKAAPPLIKALDHEHLPELERMAAEGGDFAQALLAAYRQTFVLSTPVDDPKALEQFNLESSTSSDTDVGTSVKTEMQPEIKDEFGTKMLKVCPPSWDNLSEADKMLVRLRAETGNWNQISQAWCEATGANASIKTLLASYGRITADWWQLKYGDEERLVAAEAQVEAKFRADMWGMIADVMVEKGADRYPPSFLRKTFNKFVEAEKASGGKSLTRWHVQDP